jgi:3-hydroxy-3-methylglutaryl CoA synthase
MKPSFDANSILKCVDQGELEKFDGVGKGKYTIGLGQTQMSFCDDREGMNGQDILG